MSKETEKVIVTFKDQSYDITEFLQHHPGGKEVLLEQNGKNVEEVMKEVGHSPDAYELLIVQPHANSNN